MFPPVACDPSASIGQQQQQQQQQQQPSEELQQLQLLFAGRGPGPPGDSLLMQQQQQQSGGAVSGAAAAAHQYLLATAQKGSLVPPHLPGAAPAAAIPTSLGLVPQQGSGGSLMSPTAAVSRLLLFVDKPSKPFLLQDGDVRACVAPYGPVESVVVLRDRAAAEICFGSSMAASACAQEIDKIPLEGVGLLRALPLALGVPAAAAIPDSAADPLPHTHQQQQQQQQQPFAPPAAAQWPPGAVHAQDLRPNPQNDPQQLQHQQLQQQQLQLQQQQQQQQQHNSSFTGKRVCRLELVGLFGEEPTFSVAAAIRGPGDGNIQYILEQAKHKIDIGIRGKPLNDAPVADRLHLTLASDDAEAFDKALAMSEDLVQSVCDQFISYCRERQIPLPSVGFRRHMYQQQADAGGAPGPLIYLGATERLKAGSAPALQAPAAHALSPAAAAATAAATAAAATAGGALLPPMLPPGVLAPGPLSLAALAAAGIPGGPLGPLVPPGALGAAGVLGPPPFLAPPLRPPPPANGDYEQRHRERSRSRDRGPPRDRDGLYRGGSPRRGAGGAGGGGRQPRRGNARGGPPGRAPRGPEEGSGT